MSNEPNEKNRSTLSQIEGTETPNLRGCVEANEQPVVAA